MFGKARQRPGLRRPSAAFNGRPVADKLNSKAKMSVQSSSVNERATIERSSMIAHRSARGILVGVLCLFACQLAFARIPHSESRVASTRVASDATNELVLKGKWHAVTITPSPEQPKIHTVQKLNPVWWFKNIDDPQPPAWYRPDDKLRVTKWYFRNPMHNFTRYVIGVGDKKFDRIGHYPERIANPNGGWNFAWVHRKLLWLPGVSFHGPRTDFYLGWQKSGNFGTKFNLRKAGEDQSKTTGVAANHSTLPSASAAPAASRP
jgi:hypothetical protein